MKIFRFFSLSAEKEFAQILVQQLLKELPPGLMKDRRKILSVNKITGLLERTFLTATAYQNAHNMGFIRRAVLANNFKWALKNRNYPDDFVDVATEGLVVAISKVNKTISIKK